MSQPSDSSPPVSASPPVERPLDPAAEEAPTSSAAASDNAAPTSADASGSAEPTSAAASAGAEPTSSALGEAPASSTTTDGSAPTSTVAAASDRAAATGGAPVFTLEQLRHRPSYAFFGWVAAVSLLLDLVSKAWAEVTLSKRTIMDPSIVILDKHLSFTLAYNKGGAWGLLHDASEAVRRPFFLLVSVLAIAFIVSLYSRLAPTQRALKWGLPLVLGGALGNLSDRITRSSVVDFIDYSADWIASMNRFIAKFAKGWSVTDHWPTFNVADIFICVGVGLMAVDMVTSRRRPKEEADRSQAASASAGSPAAVEAPSAGGGSSAVDVSTPAAAVGSEPAATSGAEAEQAPPSSTGVAPDKQADEQG